ncbi:MULTISPECIES: lipopolysaccharide assembly protein LapA domain-containing protein [Geodermatophilus]|uniref:Lipopolysaccharide assembly protein LapA domain-containing protein n=1 Tax=Geodermatophilus arenarius TaxID=1137990 RepID=A0ABV9LMC0_9ACTN
MTAPGSPADPRYPTSGTSAPGSDPLAGGYGTPSTSAGGYGTPSTSAGGSPAGTSPATPRPSGPSRAGAAGRTVGRGLALGLLLFVTVLLVLFVVFNGQTVQISLVFGDVQAPLVVALLIAAALGALVASLAGLVLRARRRNR